MNLKKLLDLFEAPAKAPANLNYKGTAGTQAIQGATNQAKPGAIKNVNVIKPGQQLTLPGSGSYQVKAGDTMDKIARRNPVPTAPTAPTVSTATGPAATAPAPSTDNEALKGQVIAKAMNPPAVAANPGTAAAGVGFNQAAGSSAGTATTSTVPTNQSLDPGEEIVSSPTDTQTAPYNGAAANAMASRSAPAAPEPTVDTRTSDQIATAQLNTPAMPTADTRTSDQIATAQLNTPQSDLPPRAQLYGYVSEEDAELNELMRLSGRPVNEKAVSKQQQKFMGMVHAMQKGKKIKGASPELKKVAKTMNNKDAKDFASTKHKGLPTKVSESVMLEAGSALEHIINKFKHETKNFLAGNELDSDLLEALFDYYADNGEMPYGVAKARDGDPYQWIDNKFEQDLSMMGHQRDFNAADLGHDHELTELARLAGLTNEDGPGASRLYTRDKSGMGVVPKDTPKDPGMGVAPKDSLKDTGMGVAPKQTSLKDKMSNEGLSDVTDTVIDKAKGLANKVIIDPFNDYERRKKERWDELPFGGTPGPGHSGYIPASLPRFQTKADAELADKKATDKREHDALTGASNAAAAQTTPPADAKRIKEDADLNQMRRIAGLKECGDMSMDSQQDSMNVSTNMSSDGNKSVNISAQGDRADALLQMLKMAGMRPHDNDNSTGMTEPEIIMIGSNDEEMMDEEYANTPDEEYQSVDSIIRQGNDLNREKRQYAGKPKLGDNPMAEGVYDPDYRGNYNNEFDELEDLFSKSAMDSSEMNRQRFLANKHGINSPSDMSKLPALRKDAEAGYKTRKSEIDADTERKNQQYMQDKLMDLEYEADPSAFMQRRMQQSSPKDSRASSMDLPKADYSLGGRGAKLPNFNLEPAAPDANDLLDKATDQLDSRLRSRPSMSQQLAQLRNRTRQSRMAESLLDADLDAMLESILIREEDSAAKKVGDAVKNPSNAAKDVGDKVKGRLTTTKGTDGKTSVTSSTGRIRATFDKDKPVKYEPAAPAEPEENEKTNEGVWDTVKDIAGGILGTEDYYLRHDEQLPQLKAMQDQYKGTPYEQQVNDRYRKHLDRLQLDGGPVMTKGPDGRPMVKPVLPPDQFEKGNKR